jgi:predicted nuclease of predicted toxin-antitoxin system
LDDPFLIDECLSPKLVAFANARGHHATHVVFRNLQGTPDDKLMPLIKGEGFVLVTSNGRDFLPLFAKEDVHAGLIVLVPANCDRDEQVKYFGLALDVIETLSDLINKLLVVSSDGSVELRDWPARATPGNL